MREPIQIDPQHFFQRKEVQELFQGYGVDKDQAELIRANTNLIYDCGTFIIRLTPAPVRTKLQIESELAWLSYLREKGAPVVKLVSGHEAIAVEVGTRKFWGVVFDKIKGRKVEVQDWTGSHFERLGQLSGQMHRLGQEYQWADPYNYQHWNEIPEFHNYPKLAEAFPWGIELHERVVERIMTLSVSASNYGLIHYDIHHGNYLLKEDGKLEVFDFELCCQSWYVHDVATVLYYASTHPKSQTTANFQNYFLRNFWVGYQREFPIPSEEEQKFIPTFLLYRDLMVYGYLMDIWFGKSYTNQQQQYLKRMEQSIADRKEIFESS